MPKQKLLLFVLAGLLFFAIGTAGNVQAETQHYQQPTGSIATVTGTPSGPLVTVNADQEQLNVRSGPSTNYPRVGVLIAGQQVPAMGRTPGGLWIQVVYPGVPEGVAWVYSGYVTIAAGNLPIIEPPPTPTPRVTPTVDPTLAAQFDIQITPTRLPTYTAPAPLVVPSFEEEPFRVGSGGIPIVLLIIGLGVVGIFGFFVSLLRGR